MKMLRKVRVGWFIPDNDGYDWLLDWKPIYLVEGETIDASNLNVITINKAYDDGWDGEYEDEEEEE